MIHYIRDTSILRLTLLRDIHSTDDLKSCNDCRKKMNIVSKFLIEGSVNTNPDTHHPLQCFYMYIGSPLSGCLLDHGIDDLDNRGTADTVLILSVLLSLLDLLSLIRVLLSSLHSLMISKIAIQCKHDLIGKSQHRLHLKIRDNGKVINGRHIHGVNHCKLYHIHVTLEISQWNHTVLSQHLGIHQSDHLFWNLDPDQRYNRYGKLARQCIHNICIRCHTVLHQGLTDLLAGFLGKLQGFVQLFLRN